MDEATGAGRPGEATGTIPVLPPIVSQPVEPPSSRPTSARGSRPRLLPPTDKFVQETLSKLSADSARAEAKLPVAPDVDEEKGWATALPTTALATDLGTSVDPSSVAVGKGGPYSPWWESADDRGLLGPLGRSWIVPHVKVEQLREAFREEAKACVQCLREELVEGTRTQIAAQLAAWREADVETLGHVNGNVKELSELASSLREFISQVGSPELKVAQSLGQLGALKADLSEDLQKVAERAATRAVTTCTSELNALANEYHSQFFKQREFFVIQEQHWYDLQQQMAAFNERLEGMDDCTKRAETMMHEHESARQLSHSGIDGGVLSIKSHLETIAESLAALAEQLQSTAEANTTNMEQALRQMMVVEAAPGATAPQAGEGAGEVAPPVTLLDLVSKVHAQVGALMESSRKDLEDLQDAVAKERQRADEEGSSATQLRAKMQELDQTLAKQTAEMDDLSTRFTALQTMLADATSAPAAKVLRKIKDIEARGRVRIHRQTGEVELLSALEFVAVPQGATVAAVPEPEFKDEAVAAYIISDVAELMKLFDVGIAVEVRLKTVKGKEALLEKVASRRAEILSERFIQAGVPAEILSAVGLALASEGVAVKIDKGVFPEWQELGNQRSATKGKASPRRK